MKKKPIMERIGNFMEGKGFYIVLFLCVAAIGISGYYLFSSLTPDGGDLAVAAPTQVIVTPKPTPTQAVRPSVAPTPAPTPKPKPTPTPIQTPTPVRPAAPATYVWPVHGQVVGDYSLEVLAYDETMGDWRTHSGMDIAAELGTHVSAITDGTVEGIDQDVLMGTTVTIDHGDGLKSVYSNLAPQPTVETGDQVTAGAVIGSVGRTAVVETSRADHLHLEIMKDGDAVDPEPYLPK